MTVEDFRKIMREWYKVGGCEIRVEQAKSIIRKALEQFRKPYVAFSGGKDSTCLLHLVLQQEPNITVVHWDFGPYKMPREIENQIIENARRLGARDVRVYTSDEYQKGRNASKVFERNFFSSVIPELASKGYDCAFVGLRKEESCGRKNRINANRSLGPIKEVWPIQDWSWRDVWAYIFVNNLPYPEIYDVYGAILGWDKSRFASFFDLDLEGIGVPELDGFVLWRFKNIEIRRDDECRRAMLEKYHRCFWIGMGYRELVSNI